ncbi:MAG TPA: radical SAM family heme chaperone HemW, partial [Actinomycetota bacterium]|nr:radical SAM family heme chaperone HemW [Actinomycetota bacterium]
DVPVATSLFIGGGTPTVLAPSLMRDLVTAIREVLPLAADGEVTMEANPESVTEETMRAARRAGVNRVSIGAQSFEPHVLRALGRTHSADQISDAARISRAAGIENLSLDLIYGGPGETIDGWAESLRLALDEQPAHISAYALTIEAATPFGKAVARSTMSEPDQDDLASKYEIACTALERAGYRHYEISNWARTGFESRHNLLYWTQGDYAGLGLGAHSHRDGHRWWNTRALTRYLATPTEARDGEESLTDAQRAEEWLSLRMRLIDGVDLAEARARLGRDVHAAAEECRRAGLLAVEGETLRLTTRGMLLENEVTLRLLGSPSLALDMVEC